MSDDWSEVGWAEQLHCVESVFVRPQYPVDTLTVGVIRVHVQEKLVTHLNKWKIDM